MSAYTALEILGAFVDAARPVRGKRLRVGDALHDARFRTVQVVTLFTRRADVGFEPCPYCWGAFEQREGVPRRFHVDGDPACKGRRRR